MPVPTTSDTNLDLSRILQEGDHIFVGQAAGEPTSLVRALVDQRDSIPPVSVLMGLSLSGVLRPEHCGGNLKVTLLGGLGTSSALTRAGRAEILPAHLSQLPLFITSGRLRVDVVFVQVSTANEAGEHSLGVTADLLESAMKVARVVIAEVNENVPWTEGATVRAADLDHVVLSRASLPTFDSGGVGTVEEAIGRRVSELIENRSVLQLGIGKIPAAIARELRQHSDLGVHSGLLSDPILDLIECGAVTNRYKTIDRGKSVTGTLMGSERLYRWADHNESLALRPVTYTHSAAVLQRIDQLVSINSAIEVDLTGQVNSEIAGSSYIGTVGGLVDFVRGARNSKRGMTVIALPSTTRDGLRSRIVANIADGCVSAARTDVDFVVTEHGVASLAGDTLGQRTEKLIALAHPAHRDELQRQWAAAKAAP